MIRHRCGPCPRLGLTASTLAALLAAPGWAWAGLHYALELADGADRLAVALCSDHPLPALSLQSGERGAGYLLDVSGPAEPAARRRGDRIQAHLDAGQCLHYTVDTRGAARGGRFGLGWRPGAYLMLPLAAWWWRPASLPEDSTLALRLPAGWSASLPFPPDSSQPGRYRLPQTPAGWEGVSAFGRFREQSVPLPGGRVRISVLPAAGPAAADALGDWVASNARVLLGSFGRLPLADAQVLVVPLPDVRSAAPWAQVLRGGGNAVQVFAGLDATDAARASDWTLAHEFSHLFHPYLGDRGRWLGEGLASYFQNVLRARSGALSAEEAWRRLDAGFGRGLRERSSDGEGLGEVSARFRGGTMRVYWSGAAFWLQADALLRESHGTCLDAVLAAFAARHLPAGETWPPERFVAQLDVLAGTELFVPLYREYARGTRFPNLDQTYQRLGLGAGIGSLRLRTDAPAAAVRQAIMAPPALLADAAAPGTGSH